MTGDTKPAAGFCGKLPVRADFITRRVPLTQVERWHDWLAEVLASTRNALGGEWLNAYLYGPIWRFALPAEMIGPGPVAGILMPSVDAVGRYFPLTVMLPLASSAVSSTNVVLPDHSWFDAAEALSLGALEGEIDIDALNDRLGVLIPPVTQSGIASAGSGRALPHPGIVFAVAAEEAGEAVLSQHASTQLALGNSLWWTRGSERVPQTVILASGLPTPASFAALFGGDWANYGWQEENLADPGGLITGATVISEQTLD